MLLGASVGDTGGGCAAILSVATPVMLQVPNWAKKPSVWNTKLPLSWRNAENAAAAVYPSGAWKVTASWNVVPAILAAT